MEPSVNNTNDVEDEAPIQPRAETPEFVEIDSPIGNMEPRVINVNDVEVEASIQAIAEKIPEYDDIHSPIYVGHFKDVAIKVTSTFDDAPVERVLCIDGGGVKGVVEGTILRYLHFCFQRHHVGDVDTIEADLKSFIESDCDKIDKLEIEDPDKVKEKTCNYDAKAEPEIYRMFDLIAGTSTGSIIASAIARLHWNPDQIITEAKEIAERVFPKPSSWNVYGRMTSSILSVTSLLFKNVSKYSADAIEEYLLDKLKDSKWDQKDSKYGDRQDPTLGVLCTNFETSQIHIYDSRHYKDSKHVTIPDAVRASTAAPTYFPPKKIKDDLFHNNIHAKNEKEMKEYTFVDGGLSANVPANYVMHMIRSELGVLLSIGCGDGVPSTQPIQRIISAAMNNEEEWRSFVMSHPHEHDRLFRIIPSKESNIGGYDLADSDKVDEMREVYTKSLRHGNLNDFIKPTKFIFAKSLKIKEVKGHLIDKKAQLFANSLVIESRYNKEIFEFKASTTKSEKPVEIILQRTGDYKHLKPIILKSVWNEERDDFTLTYRDIEINGSPINIRRIFQISDDQLYNGMEPNTS